MKTAIILGGSSGVGLASAQIFASTYEVVCIVGRNEERLRQAKESLRTSSAQIFAMQGDVSLANFPSDLDQFLKINKITRVTSLICNAGGPPQKRLEETSDLDWNNVIETSLLGQIRVVKSILPKMLESKFGRIIYISSTIAIEPSPSMVLSATARAGMSAFIKSVATEYAPEGITMNAILLGGVETQRLTQLVRDRAVAIGESEDKVRADFVSNIPIGRFANPEEIAAVVQFLASDEAGYLTGQSLVVDGGMTKSYF